MPARRSPAPFITLLLVTLPACAGGEAQDGDSEPATTSTGAATSSTGATQAPDTTSTGGSSGAVDPTTTSSEPPVECGALSTCGVQCTDLMLDPGNCGKCGVSCVIPHATPGCAAGVCAVGSCDPGWVDCDADVQNGCENPEGAPCIPACKPGSAEQCNLLDDNCDGQCDEGGVPGCRQPVHRASSPTLGHFYTLDQAEAASGDYKPEFLNYFYTHAAALPGLVALYRCLKGDGKRFYTTSATCEGAGPVEGVLGQIATEPLCGAVPLYRLYGNADHFYTISPEERDNAVAMFGYTFEAQVGFVWPGP